MKDGSRRNVWLRHGAIALAYALGYVLLRQVSWSHWVLFSGYRLAVLLLVPYRYWPALVVGELGPVAYVSFSCIETFGWVWSSLMLVPPIALAMPVVRACRDRLNMIPARGPVRMGAVLICTLAVSALWTFMNMAALSVAKAPSGFPPINYSVEAARWFIGNYLGILTLVPLVLMVWEGRAKRAASWRMGLERALRGRLAIEVAAFVVPALALLVWIGLEASGEGSRQVARMLMFLPVVWLALRHGWHGAAIGGTVASVAVVLTMPELYDTSTLQAEVFVAFAATSMLLFGSRIAVLHQQKGQGSELAGRSLDLARRIQAQCEAQLRQTSVGIELISETIHATEELMFERLRQTRVTVDPREFRRRTTVTREQLFQLADGLNPVTLREHGLVAALRRGGIARALNTQRIGYWCAARGGIDQLSSPVQLALHRLVSEAITYLCSIHSVGDLTVRLRSGRHAGRRWAVVRIDALFSADPGLRVRGGPLLHRLAATGLGIDAIRDRAALYEGTVKVHASAHGECISAMVYDDEARSKEWAVPVDSTTPELFSFR
ncbi:MASE1 domain-containing protein [Rhodanobacter umsongensis]|uniref:MASE1 domain-containing protein n=1 Tax=Rhodanobacter umsongensis TaxID=633153 RepID=A0ABW0JN49_9GAMM